MSDPLDHTAIVYFGNDFFAENRTSAHHIARLLAQRFPLLYVETPGLRAPQASGRDVKKLVRKLRKSLEPPRRLEEGLWHMTVPQIPFRSLPLVPALNRWLTQRNVRAAAQGLGFGRYLTWFTVPHLASVAGQLGEQLCVYYCVDDYAALPDVNAEAVRAMDEAMTRQAGLIFAVSRHLEEKKRAVNPQTVYSPHGVDVDLFLRSSDTATVPASRVAKLTAPVIGYFGVFDARMDLDLLRYLVSARPQWTFLLIGRVAVDMGDLAARPNLVTVGAVPYEQLPRYARVFDVCLMPYRQGDFAQAANPLKLREYLATGKPVVSTPMPELGPLLEHVRLAETHQQFLAQLDAAVADRDVEARARRLSAVAQMSWPARVESVLGEVRQRLAYSKGRTS